SGSAGAIMGLSTLHSVTGSPEAIVAIREAAEHLVEHAQAMPDDGVAWPSQLAADGPLVGCSHGVAGIALSLLTASALCAEPRFERVARAALSYERSTYSDLHDNWPDRRTFAAIDSTAPESTRSRRNEQFMLAWCHGAPGIGLARLAGLRYADDSNVRG